MGSRHFKLILKIAVSVGMIGFVVYKADLHAMGTAMLHADPKAVLALLGSICLLNLAQVLRWKVLLKTKVPDVSTMKLMQFHFISVFFQSFLPSSMSVDIVKGFLLSKITDAKKAYGSVAFARFLGMVALFVFTGTALLIEPEFIKGKAMGREIALAFGGMVLLSLVLFSKKVSRALFSRFIWLSNNAIFKKGKAFREELYNYRYQPRALFSALFLSVAIYFCSISGIYYSFQAVHVPIPFSVLMIALPIVYAVMLLPVFINGIGAREGVQVVLLASWGANYNNVLAASLISYIIIYGFSLVGGFVYLSSGLKGVLRDQKEN